MDSHIDKSTSSLCFNKEDFMADDFSVDRFVSNCRRHSSLETMREHLNMYHKILCAAMVELINKDYVDLVNLSTNLVGLDKSIKNLSSPLEGLKDELDQVKSGLKSTLDFATDLFDQRAMNHAAKVSAYHVVSGLEGLEKLADLNAATKDDIDPLQLERAAFSYNAVKFHMQKNTQGLQHNEEELQLIGKNIEQRLQKAFLSSLSSGNDNSLTKILRIYSLINEETKAEVCFRLEVVRPFMKNLVTQSNITKLGLPEIYEGVLGFVSSSCHQVLGLTQKSKMRSETIPGYEFLVNSVWPELTQCLGYISSVHLYSVGDPQLFHQNFSASMEFLDRFETFCGDRSSVRSLRDQPSYKEFVSKWNLDVYFQIRFQEIAGEFEKSLLEDFAKSKDGDSSYSLTATESLWSSLSKSWSKGVFLTQLKHQFWRLTLQLLSRYKQWASTNIKLENTNAKQLAFLIKDVQLLLPELRNFFETIIQPNLRSKEEVDIQVCATYRDTLRMLEEVPEQAKKQILKILQEKCSSHLKWIANIPQRFRKTNRELPSKPSPYVSQVLAPLTEFSQEVQSILPLEWRENCEKEMIDGIMRQCAAQMSDVLTSIKKIEDSLKILKRARDKPGQSTSGAVSDDDKIRRQLAIDVRCFEELITKSCLHSSHVDSLLELKNLVTFAEKAAAVAITS